MKSKLLRVIIFSWLAILWIIMMIDPNVISTKSFGLILSVSIAVEMAISIVNKNQFQKEEISTKIKALTGIMILLLLIRLIF